MKIVRKNLFLFLLLFFGVIGFLSSKDSDLVYDHEVFRKKYLNSQWVVPNSKTPISDEELYIYAGNEYIRGTSPILINPEILPLPKYIIGAVTVLTDNPYFAGALFYFLSLVFALKILEHFKAGLLQKLLILSLIFGEILRLDGFLSALIEPFLLFFFLGGAYFYLKRRLLLASLFFALFINSKNFLVFSALFYSALLTDIGLSYLRKRKVKFKLKLLLLTVFLSLVFLYLSYLKVLIDTRDFLQPLKIQKYVFSFYKTSVKVPSFMAAKMVFLNKWHVWWADKVKGVPGWWIFWPLSLLLLAMKPLKGWRFNLLVFWILFYFVFLNFIPVWPRYFLLLFVPLYLAVFI